MQAIYGSDERRAVEFEHGGRSAGGLHWYLAGNLFGEDGWRDDSPSDVRQVFGKLGWQRAKHDVSLTAAYADNSLTGNGLQEQRFLERDYASVYTKPDITDNRSTFLNLTTRHTVDRTRDRSRATPTTATSRRTRSTATSTRTRSTRRSTSRAPPSGRRSRPPATPGVPASGADATNTPFPFWRCIGNVLLNDEPAEKCNGLINRTRTAQHNAGGVRAAHAGATRSAATATSSRSGGAFDRSRVGFVQSTELGYLNPDRSVTGVDAFGEAASPAARSTASRSTRASISTGSIRTWSLYATDTLSLGDAWHLTLSGRYNRTTIRNRDRIEPGGGPGSLDGDHVFRRFNPAAGVTFSPSRALNVYAGLQRRQPRRHVDRARLRRSGRALQAAERDGRRSAARSGRHQDVRRRACAAITAA